MTVVTADLADITGQATNARVLFASVLRVAEDGKIITTEPVQVEPVAGVLTADLIPGPATPTITSFGIAGEPGGSCPAGDLIRDMKVWDSALTSDQIAAL